MADAKQIQFRSETVMAFERGKSLLPATVLRESMVKGNQAVFLVSSSGGASAVTRGANGKIPSRSNSNTQYTVTLTEWHDKVEITGFNILTDQGDQERIMQETVAKTINRKCDDLILSAFSEATNDTGAASTDAYAMAMKAKVILANNDVTTNDGLVSCLATPAFMARLMAAKEFSSAEYVKSTPFESNNIIGTQGMSYYRWLGVNWIEHTGLPGLATAAEKCYMYHRDAIGVARPSSEITVASGYNQEDDFSYCRMTAFMGAKLLQNKGVVVITHDGSGFAAS